MPQFYLLCSPRAFFLILGKFEAAINKTSFRVDGDKVNAVGGAFDAVGDVAVAIANADLVTDERVGDVAAVVRDKSVSQKHLFD